jgi:hypothetical protein
LAAGFKPAAGSGCSDRAFERSGDEAIVDTLAAAEIHPRYF